MRYLIVGGGVVGLSLARSLLRSGIAGTQIRLLEKEQKIGLHTSGRNSGVLHAGFYYASDSQKARFCKQGNRLWQEFCDEHNVPIKKCGKLVVCKSEEEVPHFHKLYE
jgi:L-2-hydroxyglutarate oxidase LhgO